MKKFLLLLTSIFLFTTLSFGQTKIPSVQIKDLNGKAVNTSELNNAGKPFVISFFATWCKPCMRELKAIHELYPDWQEETGVKIYAVSIDEGQNVQKVKPLVDGNGWEYEVLLDSNSDFKRALQVNMIPATFVVNGNGVIVYTHSGYTDGAEEELYKIILEHCDK